MSNLAVRIARLNLPTTLETQIYKALRADNADHRHERLCVAWEATSRAAACAMWAVCRSLDLRSPELEAVRASMSRPSFGHWIAMMRVTRALLESRKDSEVVALRPLLDGLQRAYGDDPELVALAEKVRGIPGKNVQISGKTVFDLVSQMPAYRNAVQSTHREAQGGLRAANAGALQNGLLTLCERAPPLGNYAAAVVHRLSREDAGYQVELATMHGSGPLLSTHVVEKETWESLTRGRVYLFCAAGSADGTHGGRFVSLHPLSAAELGTDGWTLGWLEGKFRGTTMQYEASASPAGSFRVTLEVADYNDLLATTAGTARDDSLPDEVLALDPYRGLLAYDEVHAPLFFGRDEEIEQALSRSSSEGCLVLCGASGSGKSSLMRAGILPRLRATPLIAIVFTPGARPMESLRRALLSAHVETSGGVADRAAAWSQKVDELLPDEATDGKSRDGLVHLLRGVAGGGRRVVLAVDQLEEVATLCTDAVQRRRFLDVLSTAASKATFIPATILATVRADLLGELFDHEGARELVERHLFPLGAIVGEKLSRVIAEPLKGRRVTMEPGLDSLIVQDVGDQPGSLSLLSQVLTILWDERGKYGDRLTKQGYEAAGRVAGALQKQADAALAAVDAERRPLIDKLLLQLAHVATPEEGSGFTRRRMRLGELAESVHVDLPTLRKLIVPFVERRLFVMGGDERETDEEKRRFGGDEVRRVGGDTRSSAPEPESDRSTNTVEVAHESLLTAWPHAANLLRGQTEVLSLRREISLASRAWERSSRTGELWSDSTSQLARAEELLTSGRLGLTKIESEFLLSSRRSVLRRRQIERVAVGGLVLLTMLALAMSYAATQQRKRAERAQVELRAAKESAEQAERRGNESRLDALGGRASALAMQSGLELEGLRVAIEAAAPSVLVNKPVPAAVMKGLVATASAVATLPQRGHTDGVKTASFSPAGTPFGALVVTGSWDHTARIWDATSGRLYATLQGHTAAVRSASFSPDASRVVTSSRDGSARLWSTARGTELATLKTKELHAGFVHVAQFSPDGTRVVTASDDHLAALWSGVDGTLQHTLVGHTNGVNTAAFSPDGAHVVTASVDASVRVWDVITGKQVGAALIHPSEAFGARYSADGSHLLTTCADHNARIYDVKTPASAPLILGPHDGDVEDGAFSPDGKMVVTACDDHLVRLWDAQTGKLLRKLEGHDDVVFAAAFSPDSTRVASGGSDQTVRLWSTKTGELLSVLRGHGDEVVSVAFSSDGSRLVSSGYDHVPRIWDARSGNLLATLAGKLGARPVDAATAGGLSTSTSTSPPRAWGMISLLGHTATLKGVAYSPDGKTIVTASADRTARMWDVQTGAPLSFVVRHEKAGINGVAISSDGRRVATAGDEGYVGVWDAKTGAALQRLRAPGESVPVNHVVFAPGSSVLAASGDDKVVRLWDTSTGTVLGTCKSDSVVRSASFTHDGAKIIVAGNDGKVLFFDAKTAQPIGEPLVAHAQLINAIELSKDDVRFVTASDDTTAVVWDTATRRKLFVLGGHTKWVSAAAFSPDGSTIVTTSADETTRLWNAHDGELLGAITGVHARSMVAAFSPTEPRFVVATEDGIARIFPIGGEAYFRMGCELLRVYPDFGAVERFCK